MKEVLLTMAVGVITLGCLLIIVYASYELGSRAGYENGYHAAMGNFIQRGICK